MDESPGFQKPSIGIPETKGLHKVPARGNFGNLIICEQTLAAENLAVEGMGFRKFLIDWGEIHIVRGIGIERLRFPARRGLHHLTH